MKSSKEFRLSKVEKLEFFQSGVMARWSEAVILKIYRISKTNGGISKAYKSQLEELPLA